MIGFPAGHYGLNIQTHSAVLSELERVEEQVLDDLLEPLRVGEHRLGQSLAERDRELDVLRFRNRAERPLDEVPEVLQPHLTHIDLEGAGFNLRQVENVVDEVQEIAARRVDGLGKIRLLGVRLPSGFFDNRSEIIKRLSRGVRSLRDMFARNSDLYLELRAIWRAFFSSSCRACSASVRAFVSASSRVCASFSALIARIACEVLTAIPSTYCYGHNDGRGHCQVDHG